MINRPATLALSLMACALAACSNPDNASGDAPDAFASDGTGQPVAVETETLDGTTLADFKPDTGHGQSLFRQCSACHSVVPGINQTGPSLAGIVGREAGTVDGYNYTDANSESAIVWTPDKLFQYLEDPDRVIPGTKMAYPGMSRGQDRTDLIAYLETAGG